MVMFLMVLMLVLVLTLMVVVVVVAPICVCGAAGQVIVSQACGQFHFNFFAYHFRL